VRLLPQTARQVKARGTTTGTILVNLGGRGDRDMDYVTEHWGIGDADQA